MLIWAWLSEGLVQVFIDLAVLGIRTGPETPCQHIGLPSVKIIKLFSSDFSMNFQCMGHTWTNVSATVVSKFAYSNFRYNFYYSCCCYPMMILHILIIAIVLSHWSKVKQLFQPHFLNLHGMFFSQIICPSFVFWKRSNIDFEPVKFFWKSVLNSHFLNQPFGPFENDFFLDSTKLHSMSIPKMMLKAGQTNLMDVQTLRKTY